MNELNKQNKEIMKVKINLATFIIKSKKRYYMFCDKRLRKYNGKSIKVRFNHNNKTADVLIWKKTIFTIQDVDSRPRYYGYKSNGPTCI